MSGDGGPSDSPQVEVERIDLTIIDGELFDAHEHRDREGDGPFVNLASQTNAQSNAYSIDAENYIILLSIKKRPKPLPQPPRSFGHGEGHRHG